MKIAIQTGDIVDRLGLEKGYEAIRSTGFEAIDWNLDHAVKGSDLRKGDYKGKSILEKSLDSVKKHYEKEIDIINQNGLEINQAHAPFPAYVRAYPDTLDYSIKILKRNIEFCDYVGCKNLVIHGIPYEMSDDVNTKEDIHKLNMKLYTSLIETAEKTGVTICLENLFYTHNGVRYPGHCGDINEAVFDIDYLNKVAGKDIFGFCLDTGHANLLHQDFKVIIPKLGNRISCLHIHDNDGCSDMHMMPLTGTIDFTRFCSAMRDINFSKNLSFETFNQTNIVMAFDEELVLSFMKTIYDIGSVIRSKILG